MSHKVSVSILAASILAATLVLVPSATAEEPTAQVGPLGENCMERYMEADLGAVRVVSPNSCTYQVFVNAELVRPASFDCMDRYWESPEVADYKVVSPSSCEYKVYYKDEPILLETSSAAPEWPLCVTVIPADDGRVVYCVDPTGSCLVGHSTSTILGTEWTCDVKNPKPRAAIDLDRIPPLVGVCVEEVTHSGCYRYNDVCVMISDMVPQCVEAACYPVRNCLATEPVCTRPVQVGNVAYIYGQCVPPSFAAPAGGPEPMCMYYYHEEDLGPVRIVMRDSCHTEAYVLGEQVLPLA